MAKLTAGSLLPRISSFFEAVLHVIFWGADEEVCWIDTQSDITSMTYLKIPRNLSVKALPDDSMSVPEFSINRYFPIPARRENGAFP